MHAGSFFMLLLSSTDFFKKMSFSKISFRKTISVKLFDPDQDPQNVSPDLGPNCLQRFNQQARLARKEIKHF